MVFYNDDNNNILYYHLETLSETAILYIQTETNIFEPKNDFIPSEVTLMWIKCTLSGLISKNSFKAKETFSYTVQNI